EVDRVVLAGNRGDVLAERPVGTDGAKTGRVLAALRVVDDEGLPAERVGAIIAAQGPAGIVARLEPAIHHQVLRRVHRDVQGRGGRTGIAGRVSGGRGELMNGVRQRAGRGVAPRPARVRGGGADLGRTVEQLDRAACFGR